MSKLLLTKQDCSIISMALFDFETIVSDQTQRLYTFIQSHDSICGGTFTLTENDFPLLEKALRKFIVQTSRSSCTTPIKDELDIDVMLRYSWLSAEGISIYTKLFENEAQ